MSVAGVAHLVERHLAKVEVASSSLVTRSRKKNPLSKDKGFFFVRRADSQCVPRLLCVVTPLGIARYRYCSEFRYENTP